ncbi:MAG: hypothetical protein H6R15_2904 [Proteobacteria bacterium]|nr:hypothetical protein [Pseudomonadota bacterium]
MPKRLLFPLLLLIASSAQAASEFYCCQDAGGRRVCADTLPEQCRGRPYRILDSAGNVTKEVGPPLTAEEKAAQAAANLRKKQQEEAAREQQRKDQALLETYATMQDIDMSQRKAENDVNLAIAATQAKIDSVTAKRKKLLDEAEFYRKKKLPAELDKNLRAVEHELKVEQELLDFKKHDFETIRAKYDADRRRYRELTGNHRPAPPPAPPSDSRGR